MIALRASPAPTASTQANHPASSQLTGLPSENATALALPRYLMSPERPAGVRGMPARYLALGVSKKIGGVGLASRSCGGPARRGDACTPLDRVRSRARPADLAGPDRLVTFGQDVDRGCSPPARRTPRIPGADEL